MKLPHFNPGAGTSVPPVFSRSRLSVSRAFTLVELIAAISITTLIIAATTGVVRSVTAARARIEREEIARRHAAAALDAVSTALHNANRPTDAREILFEGLDAWVGDQPADRLRFVTLSHRTLRRDQPESEAREVEFYLTEEPQPDGSMLMTLVRRTDPTRNPPPDTGGIVEPVAQSVVSFDIQYFDGLAWRNEWPVEPPAMPAALRLRVEVVDDPVKHTTFALGRLVSFPNWSRP